MMSLSEEKKVAGFVEKSGFPFEIKVAEIFEELHWEVTPSFDFIDAEEGKRRELDIIAKKSINGITFHIIGECKHSDNRIWVFARKKKRDFNRYYNATRHYPQTLKGMQKNETTPLFDLPLNSSEIIETNNYITCGKGGNNDQQGICTIRDGIYKIIKAFIYYSFGIKEKSEKDSRNVFLLFLITNCPIYATGQKSANPPTRVDYLVHAPKFRIEANDWEQINKNENENDSSSSTPVSLSAAALGSAYSEALKRRWKEPYAQRKEETQKYRKSVINYAENLLSLYQIEVLNVNYLAKHLRKIEDIVMKFPSNTEEYWPKQESKQP